MGAARLLVVHASKRGATREIAERLAETIRGSGVAVEVCAAGEAPTPDDFDGVVIGSAVYGEHWMKDASAFVERHRTVLGDRPVWLFSSGPLGRSLDADGQDVRESAEPKEIAEFTASIHPQSHAVFFGALRPSSLGVRTRLLRLLPAARRMLPLGDFRDWAAIDEWARDIASGLAGHQTRPTEP